MSHAKADWPDERVTILVVDDEPPIRVLISNILTLSGYHVRIFADGFSALSAIREEVPDILLSDLDMPGMSGFELLSIVRRRFPAIKAIAMSGRYPEGDIPVGVAADEFYRKGANLERLLQIVKAMASFKRKAPSPLLDVRQNRTTELKRRNYGENGPKSA